MSECSVALKEWAPVVEALGRGQQIILLRKYQPAHKLFLLMMTHNFPRKAFKPQYGELVESTVRRRQRGRARVAFYGLCEETIAVQNKNALDRLADYYIWTTEHVMSFFPEEATPYVWLVRAFRLPSLVDVDRSAAVVYQRLDPPASIEGAVAVLSDDEFHQAVHDIKAIAEGGPIEIGRPPTDEPEELRQRIAALERELQEKQRLIDELTGRAGILSNEELEQRPEHERLIYQFGLVLETFGFREIQLDLPTTYSWSPFSSAQITPFRIRGREYDLKAVHGPDQYIGEVHCQGNLTSTLVKLNFAPIGGATKILILADTNEEGQLRRELEAEQFRDLVFGLKRYYGADVHRLYEFCRGHYSLKAEVRQKQAELQARAPELQESLRANVLDKPTFYQELLRR